MPAKIAVPLLIEGTKDAAAGVRLVSIQGLGILGSDAKGAIPRAPPWNRTPMPPCATRRGWRWCRSRARAEDKGLRCFGIRGAPERAVALVQSHAA